MTSRRDIWENPAELSSVCGSHGQPAYIGKASRRGASCQKGSVPAMEKQHTETPG